MEYSKSLVLFCMLYFLIINGALGLTITMNTNIVGVVGPSDVEVNCSYVKDPNDVLFLISLKAFSKGKYNTIATFLPVNAFQSTFTPGGQYLENRANLTRPTNGTNTATLTFSQIECEDERDYQCEINFVDVGTGVSPSPLPTASTNLTVQVVAAQPDTTPIMSVQHGILEGQNVTFTCFGNVGNPPGTFIWEKFRVIGFFPTTYPNETTIISEIPGGCSYNGTSNLTITMEDGDNNAVVRCKVMQELLASDVYQQTAPISVFYSVRETNIVRVPDQPIYIEGSDPVTLHCTAAGNPLPSYTWYKEGNDTVVSNSSTLVISDVIVENSGNYRCMTENMINGVLYNESATTNIMIDYATAPSPTTTPSTTVTDPNATNVQQTNNVTEDPQRNTDEPLLGLGTGIIVVIVVGLLCAIVLIVIVIVCLRKRRNQKDESNDEPPEKPRNNPSYVEKQDDLGDKNEPINNVNKQMNYADLSFEDRPRGQRPLQVSQDVELNQVIYAEVVKSRV